MVSLSTVLSHNTHAATSPPSHLTCVFIGATAGIGLATLLRLASILRSSTFHILGRSATRFDAAQRQQLESLDRGNRFVFWETEITLLKQVDATCKGICEREEKVDMLFLSAGMLPFNGPSYTTENLDECFVLSYYSRMRAILNLLPLLRLSPSPRILSVLNAGKEGPMYESDLGLSDPDAWSTMRTVNNTTTMHTLALDHLATQPENAGVVFMHAYPGWVKTGIFKHLEATEDAGWVWRACLVVLRQVAKGALWWGGVEPEECAERQVFQLLDEQFGAGEGERKGCVLLGWQCEVLEGNAILQGYRRGEWPARVWDYTEDVFQRVVA